MFVSQQQNEIITNRTKHHVHLRFFSPILATSRCDKMPDTFKEEGLLWLAASKIGCPASLPVVAQKCVGVALYTLPFILWDGATQMQDRSLPSVHPAHAESLSDELCYSLCFSVQSGGIQSSHPSFTQHSSLRLSHIAACRRTACITVSNSVSPSPNNGYLSYFHILLL